MEEIDNSSQEANLPHGTTSAVPVVTKKRTKTKKNPPAVAPLSTLTRFLGPAGPPSLSAWEDVNRRCPVCQQAGFSSRSLALHVNDCLDVTKKSARDAASDGESEAVEKIATGVASGVGNVDGRNAPKASSARGAGKVGSSNTSTSPGAASRKGRTGTVQREAPSNTTTPGCTGEQRLRLDKTAKKAKVQKNQRAIGSERSGVVALYVVLLYGVPGNFLRIST